MPVTQIAIPRLRGSYPSIPVLPVRVVGPTGPTGPGSGITATITTAKLSPTGITGTMVFTNGILTAQTQAT
jgi:hypothetical protein